MSIAKLQASLAQATNEVTVAAANINFDFCLVKYEAPKEYHPIGKLLSNRRKQDAEHGKSHVTARRLAALFDGICPDTPNLIKAYGERISEISEQATTQESKDYSRSVFGLYTGVDATSIWAAATSSKGTTTGAIHVHLLACMLSSMFDAAEATSIWAELVEKRRNAITMSWERDEDISFSSAAAAVQQEITRSQLADWDSSARAWLQTADAIMKNKQTQLRLILSNINLSMGSQTEVLFSVIEAWKKTLKTMERLISGIPQEVQDGSAIIGLAAWHIYPNITVFGSRNVDVCMNDPLVAPGGILSLGCSPSATTPISGVSWSLSLAHLKHYGQPVRRQGSFKADPTRITFKELLLATLGCVLTHWNVGMSRSETSEAMKFITLLSQSTLQMARNGVQPPELVQKVEGLRLLSDAVEEYFKDEDTSLRFINLGRNRAQFISPYTVESTQSHVRPFLGLHQVGTLLNCIRDGNARVEFLRRMATRAANLASYACIIQYAEHGREKEAFNYATVLPKYSDSTGSGQQPAKKRSIGCHARWVHADSFEANEKREHTNEKGEIFHVNYGYSVYEPTPSPRITCTYKGPHSETFHLKFWYGDWDVAAIYLHSNSQLPSASNIRITNQDLLWCLQHDLLSADSILQTNDSIMQTLQCLAGAYINAFRTIPGPVIKVQTLDRPLINVDCVKEMNRSARARQQTTASCRTISILSYLVAGHDIQHSKIPGNIVGISIGDSIFVPDKLLRDPMTAGNGDSFTRILGNIGKPGFTMFFSVEKPIMPPNDPTFWRVVDPHRFDGKALDLFHNTSMHLSFTNWERPLEGFSSRGEQDVQLALMESVISIREQGKWIGDVDIMTALKSPHIYKLPPQQPCSHVSCAPPDIHMKSVGCWDELREFRAGNVVVRANGNWLARLATTAYVAQCAGRLQTNNWRVTLCPPSVCWKCLEHYVEQFPVNVYIY